MSQHSKPDRILGVDPGLNITGYGVIEITGGSRGKFSLVEAGVIRSTPKTSLTARVHEVYEGIVDVIESTNPTSMAIEELYSHYERPRTAILMGHARGVLILAGAAAGIPVKHYAATRIKKMLTGNGRAPKSQMQSSIQREFGLDEMPTPADVADALAIALCHYYLRDSAKNVSLTSTAPKPGKRKKRPA